MKMQKRNNSRHCIASNTQRIAVPSLREAYGQLAIDDGSQLELILKTSAPTGYKIFAEAYDRFELLQRESHGTNKTRA